MKVNIKELFKNLLIVTFVIYVAVTILSQQKTLNTYRKNISSVQDDIEEATEYKDSLVSLKENASSLDYIEKIAREKLNMYMPDEKVYMEPK